MRAWGHIPTEFGAADVQIFTGKNLTAGQSTEIWHKPRGKTMIDILLIGKGGNGGTGAIGAVSTAAGGGGGGSGGQTRLTMPLCLLPDVLYLSLMGLAATGAQYSYISLMPSQAAGGGQPMSSGTLVSAAGGGNGGNAAGATAGSAGAAGAAASVSTMPLGWAYATALGGQAGIIGGTTGGGGALNIPVTGLLVCGGTGGGGVGAGGSVGSRGGQYAVTTGTPLFPAHTSTLTAASATSPPTDGSSGYFPIPKLFYTYGGLGGGSTHGSATGAGLVQASGGLGAPGSGGGGMGGALTGSTAGLIGMGGPSIAIITCW